MAVPEPDPPAAGAPPSVPALRASDADRERTVTVLRDAGGDGRLTVDELDARLDAAYAAVTHEDLAVLTSDLVAAGATGAARSAPRRVPVVAGERGSRWMIAVMGGVEREGVWRVARRATSLSVMGGSDLDLTHAEFDGEDVHLNVICVMGGADVRVPDHMNVVVSNVGIMGGNDVRIGEATPDPGGPTLHLHLVSIMGGSNVRRGPKRTRRERREQREQERIERERERDRHRLDHG
ncbi:DUF1707 domain-containing protein [Patulibacter sp.]|uniref:DUF1707 SHOCT-like domain-containing protein n=1 Tax=Patulibacter sp. TaxID=1912859 RepID=UPI00272342A1|nr:DUF1707 domain-containing protein [Patulibacter sp.]MDO9410237.1 DUF1707 domain-containing protein [Patulibacter sp.]